jgi:hypothetical protein
MEVLGVVWLVVAGVFLLAVVVLLSLVMLLYSIYVIFMAVASLGNIIIKINK